MSVSSKFPRLPVMLKFSSECSKRIWRRCGRMRRFRPPLPSHIEFRGEKPSLLRSHVFNGAIIETRGPFFISGNWWDAGRWAREEWDVETADGSLFRVFRSPDGCFVEGVYD